MRFCFSVGVINSNVSIYVLLLCDANSGGLYILMLKQINKSFIFRSYSSKMSIFSTIFTFSICILHLAKGWKRFSCRYTLTLHAWSSQCMNTNRWSYDAIFLFFPKDCVSFSYIYIYCMVEDERVIADAVKGIDFTWDVGRHIEQDRREKKTLFHSAGTKWFIAIVQMSNIVNNIFVPPFSYPYVVYSYIMCCRIGGRKMEGLRVAGYASVTNKYNGCGRHSQQMCKSASKYELQTKSVSNGTHDSYILLWYTCR